MSINSRNLLITGIDTTQEKHNIKNSKSVKLLKVPSITESELIQNKNLHFNGRINNSLKSGLRTLYIKKTSIDPLPINKNRNSLNEMHGFSSIARQTEIENKVIKEQLKKYDNSQQIKYYNIDA